MVAGASRILLLSDNSQLMASLEGALARGQFRLHRLARPEQLERCLPELLTLVDGVIVDGTAPCFSNGRLEPVLALLDRHQLGTVVLAEDALVEGRAAARGWCDDPPLAWRLRPDQVELLGTVLTVICRYQSLVRGLQREICLFQRLDSQLSGHFREVDEEMRLASRLQRDFLPKRLPAVGPLQFATLFRPASWVSGDLYDVFRLDEAHVGFYVADAVGHGMPAALMTMFIKRSMETKHIDERGYRLLGPEETLALLNRTLLDAALSCEQFTTAVYAVVNVQTLQLQLARGGHPHPLWLRADGTTHKVQADGGLLGVFPDTRFARASCQLAPGDKFILYSDGLETAFVEGDQWSSRLYQDKLEQARRLPVEQMLACLSDQMDRQAGSLSPRDDVTVVALEVAA